MRVIPKFGVTFLIKKVSPSTGGLTQSIIIDYYKTKWVYMREIHLILVKTTQARRG